jgi:hypothetical protein
MFTTDSLKLVSRFAVVNGLGGIDKLKQVDKELGQLVSSF